MSFERKSRTLRKEVFSRYMNIDEIREYRGNMNTTLAWKDFIFEEFPDTCMDTELGWDFEYFFNKKHDLHSKILTGWPRYYKVLDDHSRFILSKNFIDMIKYCDNRYVVSIVGIHNVGALSHANGIIIDNDEKKIYRFEPLGEYRFLKDISYDQNVRLDNDMEDLFKSILGEEYEFVPTLDYCPAYGLQRRGKGLPGKGFCGAWAMMFLHEQLLNPHKSPEKIAKRLLAMSDEELKERTGFYAQFLVKNLKENGRFSFK